MKKIVKRIISCIIAAITVIYCITYTTIQTANAAMFDIIISITADKEIVNADDILTVCVTVKHFQSTIYDDINPLVSGIQVEIPIDTDIYEFVDFVNTAEDNDDIPLFINTDSSQSVNYDELTNTVKCIGLNSDTPYITEHEKDVLIMKFKLKAKTTANVLHWEKQFLIICYIKMEKKICNTLLFNLLLPVNMAMSIMMGL